VEATEVASVKAAAVEDTAEVRVTEVAEDTALLLSKSFTFLPHSRWRPIHPLLFIAHQHLDRFLLPLLLTVEEEVEDTAEAKDHQQEVIVGDKVAVMEDLQVLHQFTFTFIQHLPNLIPSRSHQRLPTVEDMEVAVNPVVMEDQQEAMHLPQLPNLINNQPQLPHLIPSRAHQRLLTEEEVVVNLVVMEDQGEAIHLPRFPITNQLRLPNPITNQFLLMEEEMKVVVNPVVMEDQPEVTLLHQLPNLMNNQPQFPNLITNRFLLMEGNKEDRQEDTLLPLRTNQRQLLLMVLHLSLLEVIRTSHFSS
jgi:hypothetical protein